MTWEEFTIAMKLYRKYGKRVMRMGPGFSVGNTTPYVYVQYTYGKNEEIRTRVYKLGEEGTLVEVTP